MDNLNIALSYLRKGISVIPLYSPEMVKRNPPRTFLESLEREREKNRNSDNPVSDQDIYDKLFIHQCKQPCVKWKEYQDRFPTEDEVVVWFTRNPTANIAIITGKISNLVVFDLDSQHAVDYAEEQGGFPDSVKVKTGKGYHVYMRHPGFEVRNQIKKDIGEDEKLDIDIKADGGYVAAPPSIHGTGNQYQWIEGFSINQIDPAPCTQWMIDYLKDVNERNISYKKKQTEKEKKQTQVPVTNTGDVSMDKFSKLLRDGCVTGERNASATSLIGHLFKSNMKESDIWEFVKTWNTTKVKPPLDLPELKKTFESVKSLEDKNKKKPINIESFLDNSNLSIAEYNQTYFRVPFARDTLINLQGKMNGGFIGGRLYLLGGIPSSAKTALTNNIADNVCLNGYPIIFFSYDDGRAELRYRTFSRFSEYFIEDFNLKTVPNLQPIFANQNIRRIIPNKYVIQEMIPVEKWPELIQQIIKKHNIAPVIFIDYLRKLRTELRTGDERLRVDDIISKLTNLAKTYNIPIIAISELARDSYKSGQRLSMASFKESGTIEYESSWLGILGAVEEGDDGEYKLKENWETIINHDGNIDLIIFKAKRGTGETGKVPLKVYKDKMTVKDRIENIANSIPQEKVRKETKFG